MRVPAPPEPLKMIWPVALEAVPRVREPVLVRAAVVPVIAPAVVTPKLVNEIDEDELPLIAVEAPLLPNVSPLALVVPSEMVPAVPAAEPVSMVMEPELPDVVVLPVWMVMESDAVLVRLAVLTLLATRASGTAESFMRPVVALVISVSHDGEPVPPTLMVM